MSTTVDNRVVEMQFDNKQFENNVRTSMSTLEKLKQSLNLKGASKGLEDVNTAAKNNNLGVLGSAVETVQAKFSALQVMGVTALANITNAAVNAGTRMVKSLTIDPIMDGFREYETQLNAVQTILANTQSKGSTLSDVTAALDELNTYADLTIYNFTEMTRNIGTFTAAGVDLETSTAAIQGIANLAAISGSTSQQASVAMYQLSQALAAGTVKLMDWNSVVNAGMGGEVFQSALRKTSEELNTGAEAAIKAEGSFRESLSTGWLTSEVLTETLKKFTTSGANEYVAEYTGLSVDAVQAALDSAEAQYGEADAIEKASEALAEKSGKNKDEIKEALELAKTAQDAATKVKTFSQLMDTLKEAVGSGWAKTWQIIFGDFEEAKELFTSISDVASEFINKMSDSRNTLLQEWKDLGGRTAIIDGFKAAFEGLSSIFGTVSDAFKEIIPPLTAEHLLKVSEGFKRLMEAMKPSVETLEKIKRIASGVFSAFDLIRKGVLAVLSPITKLFSGGGLGGVVNFLLEVAASIGDFFTALNAGAGTGDFFSGITNALSTVAQGVSNILKALFGDINGLGGAFSAVGDLISNVAGMIGDALSSVFGWIKENVGIGDIFAGLAGGGIFLAAKNLAGVFSKVKDMMSGGILGMIFGDKSEDKLPSIKENICDVLDSLRESLSAFTTGIKAATLVSIAVAVGILAASLNTISKIEPAKIATSLGAIAAMMVMLNLSFKSIIKTLNVFDSKGIVKAGAALILIAVAINVFASALKKIADLSFQDIAKGLVAIGIGLAELCLALEAIDKTNVSLKSSIAMIALAEACKILGDALSKFGEMTWDEIGRGLTAMGIALGELVAALAVFDKIGGVGSIAGSASLLIAVQSLDEISDALERLGKLTWGEIGRGLSAMGGALAELSVAVGVLGKLGGFSSILGGTAIVIVVQALDEIADALKGIGELSWGEIYRGLSGMSGALAELSVAVGALGTITGFSGIVGSAAIVIVVQALDEIADALKGIRELSWEEVARGLTGMGGALTELSVAVGALGKLGGFSSIIGSGAILIVVQALQPIADALKDIGALSWEEIAHGLVGMGGALTEVSVITALLGNLGGLGALMGAGTLLLAVQGLGDLADAFTKFGGMTWDEVKIGLVGMGGALTEVAVITSLLGNLGGLGALLGSGSLLLAVQGLGDLADAFKKFGEMDWEQVKTALVAMGAAMGETALGGLLNTFSGLGAASISAMAEPLGALADSVKKWSGVTVPEGLGMQLGALASGVGAFNFSGWGADAIAAMAGPLGTLADSVKAWANVVVPEGIGEQLRSLASGVGAFNFSGWGADAIASVAEPLGTLADSVKAWAGVNIPEGMQEKLTSLANGVKAWTWAFTGGWAIGAVIEPLKNLASSVKAWNGVNIPEGLSEKLSSLATGVKAWSWVTVKESIAEPLKQLAGGVKAWNGVYIQSELGTKLESLANGVEAFDGISIDNLSGVCDGVREIGTAANDISGIDFGGLASQLSSFATAISDINVSTDSFANLGENIVGGLVDALNGGVDQVRIAASSLANTAVESFSTAVSGAAATTSSAGMAMTDGLSSGIQAGSGNVSSTTAGIMSVALNAVIGKAPTFRSGGSTLASGVATGIRSGKGSVDSGATSIVSGASGILRAYYSSFSGAGSYVAGGFASGIRSAISSVASAAISMASSAVSAAKKALGINSPSRVFKKIGSGVPEGFAMGIGMLGDRVEDSVVSMSNMAVNSTKSAIAHVSDILSTDMDSQPTIRPVVDLSNVESGASAINGLFNNTDFAIGAKMNLNAISTSMSRRNQNGVNDDVVSAIDKLRKDVGNLESRTYSIGGITYSAGDEVSNAIETLVRAVRVEGRV